jgi:hypothetical protein
MRRFVFLSLLVASALLVTGCGEGGDSSGAMANAGSVPPPPGGAPAPPDDAPPPETPMTEEGTAEAMPAAEPAEAPPADGSPDGTPPESSDAPPPDGGNPDQPDGSDPERRPPPPPPPKNLYEFAMRSFQSGADLMGYKYLNAAYVVMPQARQQLGNKMAWYPALMRPALAPRIGIALHIVDVEPKDFKGDPMAIGSTSLTKAIDQIEAKEQSDTRIGGDGNRSRFTRGSRRKSLSTVEGANADPLRNAGAAQRLHFYTGDFGDKLVDALLDRIDEGAYGSVLAQLLSEAARPMPRQQITVSDPNNPDASPSDPEPMPEATPGEEPPMPMPFAGRGGRGGRGRGGFGGGSLTVSAVAGVTGLPGDEEEDTRTRRFTSRAQAYQTASLEQIRQIQPCIVFLGKEEDRAELTRRAEIAAVDILAVFEMTLHQGRNGNITNNKLLLRVLNMKNKLSIPNYVPEALVNIEVEKWRQKHEKGVDPVEREVIKVIESLDTVLRPTPLPEALTAERAKKRIEDLVNEKPENPIPVLLEAQFYVVKGLLPQAEADKAAVALIGESGYARLKARGKQEDAE